MQHGQRPKYLRPNRRYAENNLRIADHHEQHDQVEKVNTN